MKKAHQFYTTEFLLEMINHLPDALVLIDSEMKIKLTNHFFREMFAFDDAVNFDEILGQTIRCKDFSGKEHSLSMNINCSHCKLLKSVEKAISTKSQQKQEIIVLQSSKDKNNTLRLIQFQTTYISFENQDFALLKLNDYTQLGKEAVSLISEFGKNT